jgi:hypothetical protein
MSTKISDVGDGHTPTIENRATICNYDPQLYINNGVDEFHQLRNEQVVRDFANIKPDTYELIKATNKTLLMFVDLAREIMGEEP